MFRSTTENELLSSLSIMKINLEWYYKLTKENNFETTRNGYHLWCLITNSNDLKSK